MSETVARCTHQPLYAIQSNDAADRLPVPAQGALTCVRMRIRKKPSENLTGLFLHFSRKMLRFAENRSGMSAVMGWRGRRRTVSRLHVFRKLGNDSSDDVSQLGSKTGNRFALSDMFSDFRDSVRQIHVGGHERVFSLRILAKRFCDGIFDVAYAGAGKISVHVDPDDRRISEHDRMGFFDAGYAFGQSFEMIFDRQIGCIVRRTNRRIVG